MGFTITALRNSTGYATYRDTAAKALEHGCALKQEGWRRIRIADDLGQTFTVEAFETACAARRFAPWRPDLSRPPQGAPR